MAKRASKLGVAAEEDPNSKDLVTSKASEISEDSREDVVVSRTEMPMIFSNSSSEEKILLRVSLMTMMTSSEEDSEALEDNHNKDLVNNNRKNQVKIDKEEDLVKWAISVVWVWAWVACSVMMTTSSEVVDLVVQACHSHLALSEVEWAKDPQ
jgi:hypothetical protein